HWERHPNSPPRPGEAPHPAPSARKSATQTAQKTALCAPARTQEVSESQNRPATRGTAHSEVQGDDRGLGPLSAVGVLFYLASGKAEFHVTADPTGLARRKATASRLARVDSFRIHLQ